MAILGRGYSRGKSSSPTNSKVSKTSASSAQSRNSLAALASALPQFNEAAMSQLEGMGFPTVRCQKALLATGNSDAEAAMEWLFQHMEDPGASRFFRARSRARG